MSPPHGEPSGKTSSRSGDARDFIRTTQHAARRGLRALRQTSHSLSPTTRGLLWALSAGLLFSIASASMRALTQHAHPMQALFLRYVLGLLPLVPMLMHTPLASLKPDAMSGQVWRCALHTVGLMLWFIALPHMPLADMTAIGFTGPLFVLIGAAWLLHEPMSRPRWVAVLAGFAGVLVIVGPAISGTGGWYNLAMLASAPIFAASYLLTKVLTRKDSAKVIVLWQTLLIALMSLPLAVPFWVAMEPLHWGLALIGGVFGTVGHYCLTRSFVAVDISATQSAKFVDLLWAALLGWMLFNDTLRPTTLLGGAVIVAAIALLARHESRHPPARV
jgi:drug/metabolite transporter (DMT)-like permease